MTNIYEFSEYRLFLRDWLKNQPKQGHGQLGEWARAMGVHPTLVSQILAGKKEISLEHAETLAGLLSLTDAETDFLLLLVQFSRAGTTNLRARWKKKIEEAREHSKTVSSRLKSAETLGPEARAVFYSSWLYAGIRNLTALPHMRTTEDLAKRLELPRPVIQEAIEFLLQTGLCVLKDGALDVGPKRTHLPASSPYISKHHQNWRLEGFRQMLHKNDDNLFFTFPMSLSESDAEKIRKKIPKWIEEIHDIVTPSPSQTVRCLNIDFFKY